MGLATYRSKRDFRATPEPRGKAGGRRASRLRYLIQKHAASRLHYDFRLELEGTLKSWAVPKGPSLNPDQKSLAVQVEDHPLEYGDFEGVIPKGQYGGGTVLLWDRGTWEPLTDPGPAYRAGKLPFRLHGRKLQGEWTLVQMHGSAGANGKNWLLMKREDRFARRDRDVLQESPNSVKTRRSLERIAGDPARVGESSTRPDGARERSKSVDMPATLSPQLAVLADQPPTGDAWLHEVKFDGYRLLAYLRDGTARLRTRHGLDWTAKFPSVAQRLARLAADSAILDGEVVVLDSAGRSDFQALQNLLSGDARGAPVYYAFDLPYCNGVDLRMDPLLQRKERLETLLRRSRVAPEVQYSSHVIGDGASVVKKACAMGLEGIVSKRADAPYVPRRDPSWLKSKCVRRQEFVVIGFTEPAGRRAGFGSLLLGYHDAQKRLTYAGRVGTGFDEQRLRALRARLDALRQTALPTASPPPARERRDAHWVRPKLVAEVRFTEWTRDGVLRHPVFVALRSDKPASAIVRERPVQPDEVTPPTGKRRASTRATRPPPRGGAGAPEVNGVRLTHPDKRLYPGRGPTKRDLADYYEAVAEWMVPHVDERPLSLVRCPDGAGGPCFFQRNWNASLPPDLAPVEVGRGASRERHVTVTGPSGLVACVQLGVLEIHTWNCRASDPQRPDQLVFDLDPGPGVGWSKVVDGGRRVQRLLDSLGLPSFPKTTGGRGLHVTVPIEPTTEWGAAKAFCKSIAEALERGSDRFVANMRKDLRRGKIYVDYNRNDNFATAVAPYSSRARPGAPVSMPITWDELAKVTSSAQFTVRNAARHCSRRRDDPWAEFENARVDLREVVDRPVAARGG